MFPPPSITACLFLKCDTKRQVAGRMNGWKTPPTGGRKVLKKAADHRQIARGKAVNEDKVEAGKELLSGKVL